MHSFAIVIRRVYFEAKKRRKYAKNVVVNRSESLIWSENLRPWPIFKVCSGDCYWILVCSGVLVCSGISRNRIPGYYQYFWEVNVSCSRKQHSDPAED